MKKERNEAILSSNINIEKKPKNTHKRFIPILLWCFSVLCMFLCIEWSHELVYGELPGQPSEFIHYVYETGVTIAYTVILTSGLYILFPILWSKISDLLNPSTTDNENTKVG